MKLLTIFVLLAGFICVKQVDAAKLESYIINGEESPNVPFYAYLEIFRSPNFNGPTGNFGGGTLIHFRTILTVAQNVDGFRSWRIGMGANRLSDMQWFNSTRSIIHPGYNKQTLDNNLAVIKLDHSLPTNQFIRSPARLTSPDTAPVPGEIIFIVGFGFGRTDNKPQTLQISQLTVTSNTDCSSNSPHLIGNEQILNHFCAQNETIQSKVCPGDQGGPVYRFRFNNPTLLGIVSFNRNRDCSLPNAQPPAFVRLTRYSSWINDVIHQV